MALVTFSILKNRAVERGFEAGGNGMHTVPVTGAN
jgi:hypothetical protein